MTDDGALKLFAVFDSADAMLDGAIALRLAQFADIDTFAPTDDPRLDVALRAPRSRLGWWAFGGGATGLVLSYAIQWWTNVYSYPLNVGARPVHSVPAFLPITFESAVLGAALAAFAGFIVTLRFPELYAHEDDVPGFERASVDRFWIGVQLADAASEHQPAVALLRKAGALHVWPEL